MWEKNDIGLHQCSTFWWIYISTKSPVFNTGYHYHIVLLSAKVVFVFFDEFFPILHNLTCVFKKYLKKPKLSEV